MGITASSGTGALASASASVKNNLTGRDLTVEMPGGNLKVTVGENYELTLDGPAEEIASGRLSADLVSSFK